MMSINQLGWGRTGPESIQIICALSTPRGGCPEPPQDKQHSSPASSLADDPERDLKRGRASLPLFAASPSFRPALSDSHPKAAAISQAWVGIPFGIWQQSSLKWQWESLLSNGTKRPSSNTEASAPKPSRSPQRLCKAGSKRCFSRLSAWPDS